LLNKLYLAENLEKGDLAYQMDEGEDDGIFDDKSDIN